MPADRRYPGDRTPDFTTRDDGAPTYARGKKWPASALLALPFTVVLFPLCRAAWSHMSWRACLLATIVFGAVMLPAEHDSILRGHWVYNENKILGPLIWGVPIEEPLIYYLMPPIFVIALFEYIAALKSGALRLASHTRATLRGVAGHVRRRPVHTAAWSGAALLAAATPFLASPVSGAIEHWTANHWARKVILRYRVTGAHTGVSCFNAGDDPVRHVTVEVALAAPVAPGEVVVHVPRRIEASLNPRSDGPAPEQTRAATSYAIKLERLFPREASTDEEYISISAPVRILRVQFVADEGRGSEEGATKGAAEAEPDLPDVAQAAE